MNRDYKIIAENLELDGIGDVRPVLFYKHKVIFERVSQKSNMKSWLLPFCLDDGREEFLEWVKSSGIDKDNFIIGGDRIFFENREDAILCYLHFK